MQSVQQLKHKTSKPGYIDIYTYIYKNKFTGVTKYLQLSFYAYNLN
jgi:hypothetical protein